MSELEATEVNSSDRPDGSGVELLKDAEYLETLYVEEGMSGPDIATYLDVGESTVYRYLDDHDINRRKVGGCGDAPWRDKDTLVELYVNRGLSMADVADELGCRAPAICRWLEKHEIETRSIGYRYGLPDELDDEDWLREKYVDEQLSMRSIASLIGCSAKVVRDSIHDFGIIPRDNTWKVTQTGPANPSWKGGGRCRYGSGWTRQRQKALYRDGDECVLCGISNEQHREIAEYGLHVHHIIPLRRFEDPDEGPFHVDDPHHLDNLITLCLWCHREYEDVPLDPKLS